MTGAAVQLAIEVRSRPYSPWFSLKGLRDGLADIGVEYVHMPALGGREPLPLSAQRKDVAELVPQLRTRREAFLCSEGNYLECHRHYMLAALVADLGFQVLHMLPDDMPL